MESRMKRILQRIANQGYDVSLIKKTLQPD